MQAANGSYAEAWAPYLGTLPPPEEVLAPEVFTPVLLDALQSASMVRVACAGRYSLRQTNCLAGLQITVQPATYTVKNIPEEHLVTCIWPQTILRPFSRR